MRYLILLLTLTLLFTVVHAQEQYKTFQKDDHSISSVAFSPNGKLIASGGTDYNVVLWDVATGTSLNVLKGHKDIILATAFSADGTMLATASRDKTVIIWSVQKGVEEKKLTGHLDAVTAVKFSRDGGLLLSGSADKTAILWDVASAAKKRVVTGHNKEISSVAISPDESWFATGSFDGQIKIWDMNTYEIKRNIDQQSGAVRCMATGSNPSNLAAGFENKTVQLIDAITPGAAKVFKGHKNVVYDVEFSPDDKYLASGGLDNIVRVWDIKTEQTVLTYSKFFNFVSLHFSPDGKSLATAELNTQLKIWDITSLNITPITSQVPIVSYKPVVEIVQPRVERGTKYVWLDKDITIKGSVKQGSNVKEVTINNVPVALQNDGSSFTYTLPLNYKDNNVVIKTKTVSGITTEESFVIERQVRVANLNDTLKRQGQDYGLVLVTNDYENFKHLTNPINDGKTIATELQENYGFKTEVVQNPKMTDFYAKLREYSKKTYADDDQLLIFIAGHGEFDEVFKQGYVLTKDSKKDDQTTYLSHANLKTMINNIPCKHILLIMDVCFGGTFDELLAESRGSEGVYAEMGRDKFIMKKLKYSTRKYLTSGGKEYVPDGTPGQHSPFARRYLDALRSYGGDDGILTFGELFSYVEKANPEPRAGEFGSNQPGSDFLFIYKK